MERSVRQAVSFIRSHYCEPITLSEIAAEVFVSPYHFSRIFSRDVGLTPGRYLTAVRLFAAKQMLLTTDLTVSDIVCSVGYNSVGTFTSRFTRAVGMSPTQYRDPAVARLMVAASDDFARLPALGDMLEAARARRESAGYAGVLRGSLDIPSEAGGVDVMVGVFGESAPQGTPVAFDALSARGATKFEVAGVPSGRHHVIAVAVPHDAGAQTARALTVVTREHVTIEPGLDTYVSLTMGPTGATAPPIAVTLADASSVGADLRRNSVRCLQPTVA